MSEIIETTFIHFHIPKTAGTSLRAIFIKRLGEENVAFMMPDRKLVRTSDLPFKTEELDKARRTARETGQLISFSARINAINKEKAYGSFVLSELEAQGIKLAIGHFVHSDIVKTIDHLPRTTVIRDPLERTWSHYSHWKEAQGTMWWHEGEIAYSDQVAFETFAMDPRLANYQTKRLGSLNFKAVGITDKLPEFLEEIGLDLGSGIPTLNPGRYHQVPVFDSGFLEDFKELNAEDYKLYEEVVQKFNGASRSRAHPS